MSQSYLFLFLLHLVTKIEMFILSMKYPNFVEVHLIPSTQKGKDVRGGKSLFSHNIQAKVFL